MPCTERGSLRGASERAEPFSYLLHILCTAPVTLRNTTVVVFKASPAAPLESIPDVSEPGLACEMLGRQSFPQTLLEAREVDFTWTPDAPASSRPLTYDHADYLSQVLLVILLISFLYTWQVVPGTSSFGLAEEHRCRDQTLGSDCHDRRIEDEQHVLFDSPAHVHIV